MSTLPIIENMVRTRGDTCPIAYTITDPATGILVPFAGFSFLFTVDTLKDPPDATTKVFDVVGVVNGDGKISFTPLVGDVDIVGDYFYDVQLTDSLSRICTIVKGKLKFTQDITK